MKIKTWQLIVILICVILGILLHFTYAWSGENKIVGLFSAVNESTWEHLKLAFFPMLLMAVISKFIIKRRIPNFWTAQAVGILTAISFITIFFYTYTGIIGTNFATVNISLFVISIILGEYVVYRLMTTSKDLKAEALSILFITFLLLSFVLYTFNPPRIPYFQNPLSGKYGVCELN